LLRDAFESLSLDPDCRAAALVMPDSVFAAAFSSYPVFDLAGDDPSEGPGSASFSRWAGWRASWLPFSGPGLAIFSRSESRASSGFAAGSWAAAVVHQRRANVRTEGKTEAAAYFHFAAACFPFIIIPPRRPVSAVSGCGQG